MTSRGATLARLGSETFDLLVIGGGINGAGIARDAAMRGIRTALVEHADFASGTSSRSSKLIHGGFRYLEQGNVRLVLEGCRERGRLRRLAPHLVQPQEFVFPVYEGGPDVPPVVEAADVRYLLQTVNHYFPAARLGPEDVTSAYAGLRPLIAPAPGEAMAPSSVSREEEIFASPSGLISIAGGKLTTYRLVAASVVERVIDALRRGGDARRFGRCRTGRVPLPGGATPPDAVAAAILSRDGHGLAPATVGHLADRYGSRLDEVLHLVAADRELAEPIVATLPDPRAEVLEAVEHEGALTIEDVLRRRTQVALRDETEGVAVAEQVAALMAGPLGWTPEAARAAAESYAAVVEESRRRWR